MPAELISRDRSKLGQSRKRDGKICGDIKMGSEIYPALPGK